MPSQSTHGGYTFVVVVVVVVCVVVVVMTLHSVSSIVFSALLPAKKMWPAGHDSLAAFASHVSAALAGKFR